MKWLAKVHIARRRATRIRIRSAWLQTSAVSSCTQPPPWSMIQPQANSLLEEPIPRLPHPSTPSGLLPLPAAHCPAPKARDWHGHIATSRERANLSLLAPTKRPLVLQPQSHAFAKSNGSIPRSWRYLVVHKVQLVCHKHYNTYLTSTYFTLEGQDQQQNHHCQRQETLLGQKPK